MERTEFMPRFFDLKRDAEKSIQESLGKIKGEAVRVIVSSKQQGVIFPKERKVVLLTDTDEIDYTFPEFMERLQSMGVRRVCKWADSLIEVQRAQ